SISHFRQLSPNSRPPVFTYQPKPVPKSPLPPVKPTPPVATPALNVPYHPLTGPPCPKGTTLFASSPGSGSGFRLLALVSCLGFFFAFFSGIGIASGSVTSGLGFDCDTPFDSFASTFCVCV